MTGEMTDMKKLAALCLAILAAACLTACRAGDGKLSIAMEMDGNYQPEDPFVNARLFCVRKDAAALDAEGAFEMEGDSALVEIKDKQAVEVLWSRAWEGATARETFDIPLRDMEAGKEYVIEFTGTGIEHALVSVAFDGGLVEERARPESK